jgi:hypothetical protein
MGCNVLQLLIAGFGLGSEAGWEMLLLYVKGHTGHPFTTPSHEDNSLSASAPIPSTTYSSLARCALCGVSLLTLGLW